MDDEKLEPVEAKSGRARTRKARKPLKGARRKRKNPDASQAGSPSPASGKKSRPCPQSSSNNSRDRRRKLPKRKAASGPWPPPDLSNDARSGVHKLPEHEGASLPPSPSPLNNASRGTRRWPELKTATAIVMLVGFAACLALASYYGEHRGEPVTAVPGCENGSCSSPVATARVTDSRLDESPQQQTTVPACDNGSCAATHTAVAGRRLDEAPIAGRGPNADKPRQPAPRAKSNPPGIVMSRRTGARARVGVAHAARFQAYIDDLETNHGARVLFIGGIRPGHCATSSLHPCGKALDVCQLRRGVVDSRCHLPPRRKLAQIASSHGLFEGGRWCDSDYGHAQVGATAGDCGDRRTRMVRRRFAPEDAFASFR
jgi:hypothetical protein